MKKTVLFLFCAFVTFTQLNAQDEGTKLAKKAGKDLVAYNIDPAGNKAKLTEARQKIDEAMKLPDAQASATAWLTQGNIYNTLAQQAVAQRVVNASAPLPTENLALVAFNGYKKGFNMADKKYDKKDALTGIKEGENNLNMFAYDAYERKDYKSSYEAFSAILDGIELLKANGEESAFAKPENVETQTFLAGLTAQLSGNNDAALPLYEKVMAGGKADAAVYQGLYQMKMAKGQEAEALKILSEGRQKHKDDTGLLFEEINAYLKQGKLDQLIGNLNEAISKEPKNVDLYVTLGNVYDNLFTNEKDATKSAEYEAMAVKTYNKALEIDPMNASAVYSIGAISFNKAALLTQEMNKLSDSAPNAATFAKIDKIGVEVKKLFGDALPHFKKAEALDPNNQNTLIALKEIFARMDDLEMASEFSKRLKVVQDGGKNTTSYFKY